MPSSLRKIDSSRANGAKSSGPITPEGCHAASLNAVKHGLTARTVVLVNESSEEYETVLQRYVDHFQPQGQPEKDLVHQLAAASWRLARYAGVESGLLNDKMESLTLRRSTPENQRIAIAFNALSNQSPSLALVNRYEARLHNEYQRILRSLMQIRSERPAKSVKLQNEPNPISEHPVIEPSSDILEPETLPDPPTPTLIA